MNKGSHFIGQPAYGQLINLLDRTEILAISRSNGGERYVKNFDVWHHLLIMLYAVIKRFDSLREITELNVSRGTETGPSRHQHDATQKHPVRCQCEKV